MKNQELIPSSVHNKANKLAKEFVGLAIKHFGNGDETYNPDVMSKKLAAEFHKQIAIAIDDQLRHHRMKKINPETGDYEGNFRATA